MVALVAWALAADGVAVLLIASLASLQTLLAITGICLACRFYGVVVWFDRRRTPAAARTVAAKRIRIQR